MSIGPIIDDNNYANFNVSNRGLWEIKQPLSHDGASGTFADLGIPLIPENEWDDRIRQIEKDKSTLRDLALGMGMKVLNQSNTNYCWVNAPTFCCQMIRLMETGKVVSYSPASAGAPIKGFRNIGGWGSQALEYFKLNGLNEIGDWPANAIDRRYYTDANRSKAKSHLVLEYYVLQSWQERVSCILSGIPTADGYNWWAHEVTGMHITLRSHDLVIANSWGTSWGEEGYGTLSGNRKFADDSVAITAMLAI